MAEVDFSNARIEPASTWQSQTLQNPTKNAYVSLGATGSANNYLYDINGNRIASLTRSQLINQKKQLMYLYQGTFTTSGTSFILGDDLAAWKVSNISFQNGDTYVFQINATLTCN